MLFKPNYMHFQSLQPFFYFLIFTFYSCAAVGQHGAAYKTYHYNKPVDKWVLDKDLKEISGMQLLPNGDILAIEDNSTQLYTVKLEKGKGVIIDKWDFSTAVEKKTDIEDLVLLGNIVYALRSDGTLFYIADYNDHKQAEKIGTSLSGKNDVEGLAIDASTGNLLLACKGDLLDKDEKGQKSIYSFNLSTGKLEKDPFLSIDKKKFYPSAIAIHPQTKEIYILSARGKPAISVFTYEGKHLYTEKLDRDLYPQPEGLCFAADGTMYISTEGDRGVEPTIYKIRP